MQECAQQNDSVNCGIFCLSFASDLLKGKPVSLSVDAQTLRSLYLQRIFSRRDTEDSQYIRLGHWRTKDNSQTAPGRSKRKRASSPPATDQEVDLDPPASATQRHHNQHKGYAGPVEMVNQFMKTLRDAESELKASIAKEERLTREIRDVMKLRKPLEKKVTDLKRTCSEMSQIIGGQT